MVVVAALMLVGWEFSSSGAQIVNAPEQWLSTVVTHVSFFGWKVATYFRNVKFWGPGFESDCSSRACEAFLWFPSTFPKHACGFSSHHGGHNVESQKIEMRSVFEVPQANVQIFMKSHKFNNLLKWSWSCLFEVFTAFSWVCFSLASATWRIWSVAGLDARSLKV